MLKTVTNSINASQIQTPITLPGDVTLSTGNLVIGTSGKGIDFTATPGTGTSELFADHEEGTWTPTDASGAGLSFTVAAANYTKIGRIVTVYLQLTYPSTVNASAAAIGGLPYTVASGVFSPAIVNTGAGLSMALRTSSATSTVTVLNPATNAAITNVQLSTNFVICTLSYSV
jgi:hypothetical protein